MTERWILLNMNAFFEVMWCLMTWHMWPTLVVQTCTSTPTLKEPVCTTGLYLQGMLSGRITSTNWSTCNGCTSVIFEENKISKIRLLAQSCIFFFLFGSIYQAGIYTKNLAWGIIYANFYCSTHIAYLFYRQYYWPLQLVHCYALPSASLQLE